MRIFPFFFFVYLQAEIQNAKKESEQNLLVVTVATEATDGFVRWEESVKRHNLDYKVVGMGEEWLGGDVANGPGGAHKINLLKRSLKEFKDRSDLLILFTDAYDVVITGNQNEILNRYNQMNNERDHKLKVLFSAEDLIWPDRSLEPLYPMSLHKRFLCSGGILAQADVFLKLIEWQGIEDAGDDQLYYTKAFIDPSTRDQFGLFLDNKAEFFQNLNGAIEEVSVKFANTVDGENRLRNDKYNTMPLIIHGNGPSKLALNRLSNYIPDGWRPDFNCPSCLNKKQPVDGNKKVTIAIFATGQVPFLESMLNRISSLDYDSSKISIFIYTNDVRNEGKINGWLSKHKYRYQNVEYITSGQKVKEGIVKKRALQYSQNQKSDYIFFVSGLAQITNANVLNELISYNKEFIFPIMTRYGKLWSNFWGSIGNDGFYARSDDYIDIVEYRRIGVFNVPYINSVYLMHSDLVDDLLVTFEGENVSPWYRGNFDYDMAFAANMREMGIFMFGVNENYYGRLVDSDSMPENKLHPELWLAESNRADWEEIYLMPEYWDDNKREGQLDEPCPDVMTFQFLTSKACNEIIEEAESYGKWSGGNNNNKDERLSGGYENVPTVDIHFTQLGFQEAWLYIVKTYAAPMVTKHYTGYYPDSKPNLMFIVRYKPGEQDRLRPHHDASTWTLQIALNRPGIDFEGGGTHFTRYNCAVVGTGSNDNVAGQGHTTAVTQGMAFVFPGRMTHQHQGLPTTEGTRYILVNFMDA